MAGSPPPLRGRESELDLLRRRVLSARQDGRGRIVVMSGAAGSGKSRLLQEVRRLAVDSGARTVHIAGDPDENLIPHGAVLDAVQAGPEPLLDRAVLAGLPAGPEQGWWLRQELQARLEQVAMHQPVLVCVDDLQWCGHGTLRLLRTLPPQLLTDAVVWVLTVRSGSTEPAVASTVRALTEVGADLLDLRPLDDEAVALLVGDLLGAVPDESVLSSAARAEGQPFLLVELLRGWHDERLVDVEQGRARLRGQVLPARLRDAVDRRTERLSPLARELLQIGAVLGRRFPPDLLAAMLDRPPPAVLAPLQEVIAAGLLLDDGEQIRFDHDLIREAVTAGMPAGFARVLRRHAVDVLLRAGRRRCRSRRCSRSPRSRDLEAVATLRQAAGTLSLTAPPAAADLSLRALELLPQGSPLRGELVVETVMLLWLCGRPGLAGAGDTTLSDAVGPTRGRGADPAEPRAVRRPALSPRRCPAVRGGAGPAGLPDALVTSLQPMAGTPARTSGRPDEADAALAHVQEASGQVAGWDMPEVRTVLGRTRSFVAFHRQDWDRAIRLCEEFGGDAGMACGPPWSGPRSGTRAARWPTSTPGWQRRAVTAGSARSCCGPRPGPASSTTPACWREALVEARRCSSCRTRTRSDPSTPCWSPPSSVPPARRGGRTWCGRTARGRVDVPGRAGQHPPQRPVVDGADCGCRRRRRVGAGCDGRGGRSAGRPEPSFTAIPDLADEVVLSRMALRNGRPDTAARAVAAARRRAEANPGYPLAAATALHARGLQDDDARLCTRPWT
jgi:hypothetical protein